MTDSVFGLNTPSCEIHLTQYLTIISSDVPLIVLGSYGFRPSCSCAYWGGDSLELELSAQSFLNLYKFFSVFKLSTMAYYYFICSSTRIQLTGSERRDHTHTLLFFPTNPSEDLLGSS